MIRTLIYCIIFFIILGGIGMAIGIRKQPPAIKKDRWLKFTVYILIVFLVLSSILFNFFPIIGAIILTLTTIEFLIVFARLYKNKPASAITGLSIYALIIFGFIHFMLRCNLGGQLIVYIGVIIFDAFSQVTGQICGKTKFLSSISPTKTLEGFIGGFTLSVLVCVGASILLGYSIRTGLVFGIAIAAFAFTGDLLASLFKRRAGIKDYSNWLPGQGGFLDRFDSFLFAGSAFYILTILFGRN